MQTQALVLRAADVKESDRLITALTSERGVVRAFANGARKPKSPLHAATQPFSFGSMELSLRRDAYTVLEARAQGIFFEGLAAQLSRLALANYFSALCAEFAPQEEEAGEHLRLMLNALYFLSSGTRPQLLLKSVVELRLLSLSGYTPDLEAKNLPHKSFGIAISDESIESLDWIVPKAMDKLQTARENEAVYFDCANGVMTPHGGMHCLVISPAVRTAMRHICNTPLERAFRFTIPESAMRELSQIAQTYVQYQAGKRFTELRYWEEISAS